MKVLRPLTAIGTSADRFSHKQGILFPTGFLASFTSPIWGNISGEGTYAGVYAGSATNCPNPNAQSIIASGIFTNTHITGTFAFMWFMQPITGTVVISKQDSILVPTGLTASEHPQGTVNLHWTDHAANETGFPIPIILY
jgi:hypothetical protein